MQVFFLILSNILVACSYLIYTYSIVKGTVRPHRTTRLVIFTIVLVAFFSLLAQKSTITIWLMGMSLLGCLIILLLSIKRGMGGWAKLDIVSLMIAGIGICLWQVTRNPILALYFSILADFSGSVPTLIKAYRYPQTESPIFFFISGLSSGSNLLAHDTWKFAEIVYPLYLVVMSISLLTIIHLGKKQVNNKNT